MSRPGADRPAAIDPLDAAVIGLAQIYWTVAAEEDVVALPPIAPLRDDEPAPRWPIAEAA